MDNRKDRQFYWEVKDFFNKKPDVNVKPKTEPLVNAVKNILETSKPKPAPKVSYNASMTSAVEKAINTSQQIRKAGTPEIAAFTKNISGNPFRSLTESVKKLYEQEEEKFDPETLKSSARELEDLQTQLRDIDPNNATPEQRKQYISLRDKEASTKVTRDRQLQLKKEDEEETEEAEAQAAGSTIKTTDTGAKVGVKPDFVKDRESQPKPATPGVDVEGPAVPTAEEEREAAARAQKEKETTAANQKPTTPPKDEELERRVAGRLKTRERNAARDSQEAKIQLERMKARGPSGTSRSAQANYAEALARLELRSSGKDVTRQGLSDEDIRGQEERALARERRTPEQKAADAAKDRAVVDDLNRKAAEMRQGIKSGTKPTTAVGTPKPSGDTTTDSARMNALRSGGQAPTTGTTKPVSSNTSSPVSTSQTSAIPQRQIPAAPTLLQRDTNVPTPPAQGKPAPVSDTQKGVPSTSKPQQTSTSFGSQVNQKTNTLTGKPQGEFESMASKPASLANFVPSSENDNLEPGFRELNRMSPQAGSINTIKPAEPVRQTKASSYRI